MLLLTLITVISFFPIAVVQARGSVEPLNNPINIRWYNHASEDPVGPEEDPIAQELEKRFNVTIDIVGGRELSRTHDAFMKALAARHNIPDVFPWSYFGGANMPQPEEILAEIEIDLIRNKMPGIYLTITSIADSVGVDSESVWNRYIYRDGTVLVVPRAQEDRLYPRVIVWRKDILDSIGESTPRSISDWERVFEKYLVQSDGKPAWRGTFFDMLLLFAATGFGDALQCSKGILVDGQWEPGFIQPEWQNVIITFRRWLSKGFIELGDPAERLSSDEFIRGIQIFEQSVSYGNGDWICDEPYYPGSIQERCHQHNPEARFVVTPLPVFDGVERPGYHMSALFSGNGFGFSKALEHDLEKLDRIMSIIDAIASDENLFLLTQYGIPGKHWDWQPTQKGSVPVRRTANGLNRGRLWLFSNSRFTERFLHPRIADSINSIYSTPSALYADTNVTYSVDAFFVPEYKVPQSEIQILWEEYYSLYVELNVQFLRRVAFPFLYTDRTLLREAPTVIRDDDFWATRAVELHENYLHYYRQNGGSQLEAMLNTMHSLSQREHQ